MTGAAAPSSWISVQNLAAAALSLTFSTMCYLSKAALDGAAPCAVLRLGGAKWDWRKSSCGCEEFRLAAWQAAASLCLHTSAGRLGA